MPGGGVGLSKVEHTPLFTAPQLSPWLSQKTNGSSRSTGKSLLGPNLGQNLVRAAGKQGHKHHQVGQGKQPLVRLFACRFRSPRDKAQVAAFRKIADVIDANPSQAGNFRVGKNLLARFYGNHGLVPLTVCCTARLLLAPSCFDAFCSLRDALFLEQ
jgi:hypothetical protein